VTNPPNPDRAGWRATLDPSLPFALALLVPVVFLLPPLPIDETRYLAVTWEMRTGAEWLVPQLNGGTYAHKPPLLFWLINLGWQVTGVHAWTARALALACSLLTLFLTHRLALRASGSEAVARNAIWLLLGSICFATFATAIMFDVLLATCVLLGAHGVLDLVARRNGRGIALTGFALGLGILAKGPVMLLDLAFVAATAPWWARDALRGRCRRYFGALAVAVALGAAIGLAWAVPAALHGGPAYAKAIFLNQTLDRLQGAVSTHARPWWWYAIVLPLLLLPWPLALRGRWRETRALFGDGAVRLGVAWIGSAFLAFSLIAGKQAHYLLPSLPGAALFGAVMLARGAWQVRGGLAAAAIVAFGLLLLAEPWLAAHHAAFAVVDGIWPLWGLLTIGVGVALYVWTRRHDALVPLALASLAVVLVVKLALVQGTGDRYDVREAARVVREAQASGRGIVHMGWHHGMYAFAGRLTEPLRVIGTRGELEHFVREHPDGLVTSFYPSFRFLAKPVYTQPFRSTELSIWLARDALAAGTDPDVRHSADAEQSAELPEPQ